MMTLDGLNPTNTFERKMLEYLTQGVPIPVTVQSTGPDLGPLVARIEALEARPVVVAHAEAGEAIKAIVDAIRQVADRVEQLENRPQVMADTGSLSHRIARLESVHTVPAAAQPMPDLGPLVEACSEALRRVGDLEALLAGLAREAQARVA